MYYGYKGVLWLTLGDKKAQRSAACEESLVKLFGSERGGKAVFLELRWSKLHLISGDEP